MNANDQTEKKDSISYRRLFGNRHFVALWLGQTVSFIGDYFYWLAIPIMVERLTGSALMVGLSTISSALPMLLLGPVAGVFVDRWNRKTTMLVADLLRALLVLLFLTVKTADQVWVLYVVGFLMSCVSRFFFPAQNAALPLIVTDKDDLLAANGLMQIVQTAGMLIGPALAGFAIGLWGETVAFIFDSLTFLISAGAILTLVVPTSKREASEQATGNQLDVVWRELREGIAYLFGSQVMVGVLICLSVVQLGLGAINVIWVPFLSRTFGVGAEGLGIVDSAQGAGMVVGGLLLGFLTARLSMRFLVAVCVVIIGLLMAASGMAPEFSYIVAMNVVIGIALVPAQSALMTMMQLAVPDLKRGRVGSALNALTTAAGLVSMAAAASFSEMIGLRPIYVLAGIIMTGAGVVGFVVLRDPNPVAVEELAN